MKSESPLNAMGAPPLSRLAIHTMTTRPLRLEEAARQYAVRGIRGISVWREALEGYSTEAARKVIVDHDLSVAALVRGGFFCAEDKIERTNRIEENRRLIELAAGIGAEMLVLVVGAIPKVPLDVQRRWVTDAIASLTADAVSSGVKLAIEPLHPMYAGDKSCINRIAEANEICQAIGSPSVGVAVDVYHVWWDPDLQHQIAALGKAGRLFAFHLCDWRLPTRHLLTDRTLMGEGCIDIPAIGRWIDSAGFDGWLEVEIFSEEYWEMDQGDYLDRIIESYRSSC